MDNILTYMTFCPLVGAVLILCLPRDWSNAIRWTAVVATVPPLLMAVWLYFNFETTTAGFQLVEQAKWIPSFNIKYLVGVDGVSITMVLLTALTRMLHKRSGQSDFVVSIPYASQSLQRRGPIMADGVLDLPLRLGCQPGESTEAVLQRVRSRLMDALE